MSRTFKLAIVLVCVGLAVYLLTPFWNLPVGIACLLFLLAGISLATLFVRHSDQRNVPHPLDGSATETLGIAKDQSLTSALLDATMSCMREGVIVIDETMRIVASNPTAAEIFSRIDGGLEGKRLTEITRQPAILDAFNSAVNLCERTEVEVEILEQDRVAFDLRVMPLHLDGHEKISGAIGVFFDITRLERLERVRQEFLSNVSHELRTPLTAILAFVETLQAGAIDDADSNQRFLSIIGKNASRMQSLINDILELSAIEAGTVSIAPEPVHLRLMASDVLTTLTSRADARRVTLVNDVTRDSVVFVDPRRLEQVLTNLVDNAIKFNKEGGSVTVSHKRDGRDRISVTDTGEGISPEHIKRIFERFYRVDRARSRDMGGTGLGLAIVKHLVRAHGGEVTVESETRRGSTFTVELPRAPLEDDQPEQTTDIRSDDLHALTTKLTSHSQIIPPQRSI